MRKNVNASIVLTNCGSILLTGLAGLVASESFAQAYSASRQSGCLTEQAAIDQRSSSVSRMVLWDDSTIARARTSLAKLHQSGANVIRLKKRFKGAEASAANAEAFDKNGEANFWRRDAAEVRAAIASENKRAKGLAADAGVSCPGCTYSVLIAKVEAAINAGVSARAQAVQAQQQIARYRAEMAASGCR